MPMMMALALLAQGPTLAADPREAALTCASAVRAHYGPNSLDGVTLAKYFTTLSASKSGPSETLGDRSNDDMGIIADRSDSMSKTADALLVLCRQRFPLAFATGPAKLPADDFDRRMLCFVSGALYGTYMSHDDKVKGEAQVQRFASLLKNQELVQRGIVDRPSYTRELGRVLQISLDYGNLAAIVKGCEATFPA